VFKFIGVVCVVGAVGLTVAVVNGWVSGSANVQATNSGQAVVGQVRSVVSEQLHNAAERVK
jgi:hypothetical protein